MFQGTILTDVMRLRRASRASTMCLSNSIDPQKGLIRHPRAASSSFARRACEEAPAARGDLQRIPSPGPACSARREVTERVETVRGDHSVERFLARGPVSRRVA